jgi:nucleoside-diphosphate-sugar epimerase
MSQAVGERPAAERLPQSIPDVETLDELLSRPSAALREDLAQVPGDLMILGVGGKVGPTLARMAKRASPGRRVIGVARFSDPAVRGRLAEWGVETIACDLLDRSAVSRLPRLPNVIFMAGRKFGTSGDEPYSWAMNVLCPAICGEVFHESRLVAFSTLCVYPFSPVSGKGAGERQATEPVGEYANSCVGRERVLQHLSARHRTPGRLIRLAYAIEMRYGVLHDLAADILAGRAIDLTTGHTNLIWQGDAVERILRSLRYCACPVEPLNVGAPENVSIRAAAEALGRALGRAPVFVNREADTAWTLDCSAAGRFFGPPLVSLERMIAWTADWARHGNHSHGKPTLYQRRDGRF